MLYKKMHDKFQRQINFAKTPQTIVDIKIRIRIYAKQSFLDSGFAKPSSGSGP